MWFTAWLGQSGYPDATGQILLWAAVLILLLLAGVGVALLIKRKVDAWQHEPSGPAFSLDALRRMHAAGQLSDAEFARAKAQIIGVSRSMMAEGQDSGDETARTAPEANAGASEPTGTGSAADEENQDQAPGESRGDDASSDPDRGPSRGS